VVITIADTGEGMPPEVKERLFDAFYTTKGITGTGLGLWITKGIIDKHGGRIRVRTKQGTTRQGTVFQVFLRREALAGDAVAVQNAAVGI
jgi:signal transduction histidine kinase